MYFIMYKNILWNFAFPTYQKFVASIDSDSFKKMSQSHGLIGDIKINFIGTLTAEGAMIIAYAEYPNKDGILRAYDNDDESFAIQREDLLYHFCPAKELTEKDFEEMKEVINQLFVAQESKWGELVQSDKDFWKMAKKSS